MPYLERLKALKNEKKMSCQDISTLSDIPLATVTRVFNGATPNPTFETFAKIAIALGASLDEIAGIMHPDAPAVDNQVSSTLSSYAELLREKDVRIKEKDEMIHALKDELKEEKKGKTRLALVLSIAIACLVVLILIDAFNGSFGFLRY